MGREPEQSIGAPPQCRYLFAMQRTNKQKLVTSINGQRFGKKTKAVQKETNNGNHILDLSE